MDDKPHIPSNIRIVDIARLAGVSVATVDRVIHHRGKVSAANLARINEVLRQVDYRPNLLARSLASGRRQTLWVVTPEFSEGDYWADVEQGVQRAAAEAGRYNFELRECRFDQYDRASFGEVVATLRTGEVDGAVIATLFTEQVVPLTRELDARGIPYVFVDSDIPECNRLAYFGTASADAGAVAARLLTDRMAADADIVVGSVVHAGDGGSNQCRYREQGFRDYLAATGFRGRLLDVRLRIRDEEYNRRQLDALFDEKPRIAGAVTFNSTCHLLGSYLAASGRRDVRLVGYDVIPRNEEMLRRGVVTALIAQRPEAQGYYAVRALYEHLTGVSQTEKVNNMPIDILLRENIGYYRTNIY